MAGRDKEPKVEDSNKQKTCFVVSPIGRDGSPERKHAELFLRHIVRPVLEPLGYEVLRSDTIDVAGVISTQIVKHLRHANLVVADLSFHNPNVFYELAIRHVVAKPFVHMIRNEDVLPFDVAPQRAIFFNLQDLDSVVEAKERLHAQAVEYEANPDSPSPVSEQIRFETLEASTDRNIAVQMEALFSEVRSLSRRIDLNSAPNNDVYKGQDPYNVPTERRNAFGVLSTKDSSGIVHDVPLHGRRITGLGSVRFLVRRLPRALVSELMGKEASWEYAAEIGSGVITEYTPQSNDAWLVVSSA